MMKTTRTKKTAKKNDAEKIIVPIDGKKNRYAVVYVSCKACGWERTIPSGTCRICPICGTTTGCS